LSPAAIFGGAGRSRIRLSPSALIASCADAGKWRYSVGTETPIAGAVSHIGTPEAKSLRAASSLLGVITVFDRLPLPSSAAFAVRQLAAFANKIDIAAANEVTSFVGRGKIVCGRAPRVLAIAAEMRSTLGNLLFDNRSPDLNSFFKPSLLCHRAPP
jgi:hypothetical protein